MDFQNIYEGLIPEIKEANRNITHSDFVTGYKSQKLGYKIMTGEPNQLLTGGKKVIFNLLVMAYLVLPIIIIPIICFELGNWWLLFGIIFSELFSHFAAWKGNKTSGRWKGNLIFYFGLLCVGVWFKIGFDIHQYVTFFFFCSLWGYSLFRMTENFQYKFATQTLLGNPVVYDFAIEKNIIMITQRNDEERKLKEEDDYNKSSIYLQNGDKKFQLEDYKGAILDYDKSIEIYPLVSVFSKRADCKFNLKDYQNAIEDYTEAINRMPSIPNKKVFSEYYRKRGEIKNQLNLSDDAHLDFIEADKLLQ